MKSEEKFKKLPRKCYKTKKNIDLFQILLKLRTNLPFLRKFSVNFGTLQDSQKILDKSGKKQRKFFIKSTKIGLIVSCTVSGLLIDFSSYTSDIK